MEARVRSYLRLVVAGIVGVSLVFVLALLGKAPKSNDETLLASGRHLALHLPGDPQKTNGLPTVIALHPSGHYAALLNNGYGTLESGLRQSIAILDLATNQLT